MRKMTLKMSLGRISMMMALRTTKRMTSPGPSNSHARVWLGTMQPARLHWRGEGALPGCVYKGARRHVPRYLSFQSAALGETGGPRALARMPVAVQATSQGIG